MFRKRKNASFAQSELISVLKLNFQKKNNKYVCKHFKEKNNEKFVSLPYYIYLL